MTESLFRRLLLRFTLVPALSLCVFLGVLGYWFHRISVVRLGVADATATLLESNHLMQTMIDEETGVRGYVATRDPAFLQPYHEGVARYPGELQELSLLVAEDALPRARVGNITGIFHEFAAINDALLHSDSLKGTRTSDTENELLGKEKVAMDRLRAEFAGLNAIEYGYRDTGRHAVNDLFADLPPLGIGGGVLVAVLLIWHGIYLFREITTAFRRQLAESEGQRDSLQATLQSIGDAVMVCDRSGRITLINPCAVDLTGWTETQAIGQPLDRVFHIINEETRESVESPVAKVARLGTVVELANHTLLIRKDGVEIPIDDSGAPIRDARGNMNGIILVFRSMAERKQAQDALRLSEEQLRLALTAAEGEIIARKKTEDALRESEARLQSIYETSLEYIGILNPAGEILDCNRALLEFADSKRDSLIGLPFWDAPWFAYTRGAADLVRTAVAEVAGGKVLRRELPLRRPSGELTTFDFSLAPVLDAQGQVLFIVPEGHDISDLKRVDEALRASEERLRIATETARLGTWELDLRTGVMVASGICREHFGRTPNDPFTYKDLLNAVHPEDRARREAAVQSAIEHDSVYRLEYRTEWPDDTTHWMLASGRAFRDAEGMNVRMIGVTLDVTDRRQAEAALLQSEKLAAVGRLAATIAHEINNPLESVTNLLYLARRGGDLREVHDQLDVAERELKRVSVITTQTLRFHKQSTRPRAVSASELFESVLQIYQGRLGGDRVHLKQRERAQAEVICFDGEIRQVLNNLVGNALDALQVEGGTLFLRSRKGTDWKDGRKGIVLTIADTGSGIPRQSLQKIFDPFFTTKGASGTGLGLWVSKEIVGRHHGLLRVRSRRDPDDSWTVFTLFLPFSIKLDQV